MTDYQEEKQSAEEYTSAMLGCFFPTEEARRLSAFFAGGLDDQTKAACKMTAPEEMHLTVCYMGEAKAIEPFRMALIKNVVSYCKSAAPLKGTVSGLGRFSQEEEGGYNAVYGAFDCKELPDFHHGLIEAVRASGVPLDEIQNHGFTPHVTLCYIPKDMPLNLHGKLNMPVTLDKLSFCWGNKQMPIQLGAGDKKNKDPFEGFNNFVDVYTEGGKARGRKNFSALSAAQTALGKPEHKRLGLSVEFKALPGETIIDGLPGILVEGWASVREPEDRYGDIIGPTDEVFKEAVTTYFNLNPILLYEHGMDGIIGNKPLGQVVGYKFTDYGLWIKAFIRKPVWEPLYQIYLDIKSGILRTFSIGGIWTRQGSEIVKADLFEISVVATPAQPYAVFEVARKSINGKKLKLLFSDHLSYTPQELKKLNLILASASLDYWQEAARQTVKAKYKTVRQRREAIARSLVRLKRATDYFEKASQIL